MVKELTTFKSSIIKIVRRSIMLHFGQQFLYKSEGRRGVPATISGVDNKSNEVEIRMQGGLTIVDDYDNVELMVEKSKTRKFLRGDEANKHFKSLAGAEESTEVE